MNAPRADYTYRVVNDVLLIVDLDQGNRSVTNDMENVLATIAHREGLTFAALEEYHIAYRDSDQIWDGVDISTGSVSFYSLNLRTDLDVLIYFRDRKLPQGNPAH
jgi:hypothetical protein